MTKKFTTLALAAMAAGSMASAQAAVIDFETLAADALASAPAPYGTPILLTSQLPGLLFTGATVFHEIQTTSPDYCCTAPSNNAGVGFVQSRIAYTEPVHERIVVELDKHPDGSDIERIRFDIATASSDMEFYAVDTNDNRRLFDYTPSSVEWAWVSQDLDFSSLGVIDRIEFVSLGGAGIAFALDNLNFTFAPSTGVPVPEPAGLGLVALALAAAAAASRRRRT